MIRRTWIQMGMPVSVRIEDERAGEADVDAVERLFDEIDQRFSPYRDTSEVSRLNAGTLSRADVSAEMDEILRLCEATKAETGGYFDAMHSGRLDPSGIVKGWAIERAADLLSACGFRNFFVDAGGDVRTAGVNCDGRPWRVGIRNPFNRNEIVKVVAVSGGAVATSGTAIRGQHIYNPHAPDQPIADLVSLTVIGPTIYEADRMATAAFAMGRDGISFIARRPDLEGYAIDADGIATYTQGFTDYVR